MNTFRCTRCGYHVQRPTQPYSCPQCGTQAVGLFLLVPQGGVAPQPQQPPQYQPPQQSPMPGYPAPPQFPQQALPPQQPQQPAYGQGYPAPQPPGMPYRPAAPQYPQNAGYGPSPTGYPVQQSGHGGVQPVGTPRAPAAPQYQPPSGPPPQFPTGHPGAAAAPLQPQQPAPSQPPYGVPQTPPQGGQSYPPQGFPSQQPQAPIEGYPATAPAYPQQPQTPYPQPGTPYQAPPGARPPQGYVPQPQAPAEPLQGGSYGPQQPPQDIHRVQFEPQQPAPAPAAPQRPSSPPQGVQKTPPAATPARRPTPAPQRPQTPRQRPTSSSPTRSQSPSATAADGPTRTLPPAKAAGPSGGKRSTVRPSAKAEPPRPAPKPRTRPEVLRPKQFSWAFPPEPPFSDKARPARHAPAVDAEGRIYVCTQGRLYSLTEEDGKAKIVWEYVIGTHVPGPVVVAPDGTIRIHAADGLLHCVNSAGKQHWTPADVGEPLGWAAPVLDARGNSYICAYDGGLIRVDGEGKPGRRRFFPSRRKFDSTGVVLENVLIIGSEDGYVFALSLDEDRGRNLWDHSQEFGYAGGFINSAPAVSEDGGIIVVAARDENLYGFAPNGAKAWNVKLPGQFLGSPVIGSDGHILIGVTQSPRGQQAKGILVCVDGNSHRIRWEYRADDAIESTPAIGDDGLVYFGDNSGTIHAIDSSGQSQWKAKVESPVRSAATILAPNQVAFGLDNDTIVVLKCSSKTLALTGWPKLGRNIAQSGLLESRL